MAPDVESVTNLSNLIREKALPAAEKELEAATILARAEGGEEYSEVNLEKLMPWDTSFWVERLKVTTTVVVFDDVNNSSGVTFMCTEHVWVSHDCAFHTGVSSLV